MLEIHERLKHIRKTLGLSQAEFGGRLGVTDSAVSFLEKGERNLTDQMLLSVCREYGISEQWLREGSGEMSAPGSRSPSAVAAAVAESEGFAEPVVKLLELYASLPERERGIIDAFAAKWVSSLSADAAGSAEPLSVEEQADKIAEEAARAAREQFLREKNRGSPASPSTGSETA